VIDALPGVHARCARRLDRVTVLQACYAPSRLEPAGSPLREDNPVGRAVTRCAATLRCFDTRQVATQQVAARLVAARLVAKLWIARVAKLYTRGTRDQRDQPPAIGAMAKVSLDRGEPRLVRQSLDELNNLILCKAGHIFFMAHHNAS
jgi:hypothetical protein